MSVEDDDVRLSVNPVAVDKPLVKLAGHIEDHMPLYNGRVLTRKCGAQRALVVRDPVSLKTPPFGDDRRRHRLACDVDRGENGDILWSVQALGPNRLLAFFCNHWFELVPLRVESCNTSTTGRP